MFIRRRLKIKNNCYLTPDEEPFIFEMFKRGAGYIAVSDVSRVLRRNAKIKARERARRDFVTHVSHTFLGFDMLPAAIKHIFIRLSCSDIKGRGKAKDIQLKDDYWINIRLRMHEHVIELFDVKVACV